MGSSPIASTFLRRSTSYSLFVLTAKKATCQTLVNIARHAALPRRSSGPALSRSPHPRCPATQDLPAPRQDTQNGSRTPHRAPAPALSTHRDRRRRPRCPFQGKGPGRASQGASRNPRASAPHPGDPEPVFFVDGLASRDRASAEVTARWARMGSGHAVPLKTLPWRSGVHLPELREAE